ncbi:OmpA family protein [Vibrio parahaemolyticus]|nr:OmpA family protein [Vibrio parahaemolyticus]
MFNKALLSSCLFLLFGGVLPSQAEEFGDVYFGGNVGSGLIDIASPPTAGSKNPVSLTAGVVSGVSLSHYLALETDVSYLGQTKLDENLWAWSNYALAHYPLSNKADVYVKAGMSATQSQWSPSAGIGLYYQLTTDWWLDIGYRWIAEVSDGDLYEFLIGVRYQPPSVVPEPSNSIAMVDPVLVEQPNILALLERNRSGRYLFEPDSANLTPSPELRALAQALLQYTDGRIHIIGRANRNERHPKPLSELRAQAVADFLIERGVAPERLVVTSADEMSDRDYEAEYERRVDIEFYPKSQQP